MPGEGVSPGAGRVAAEAVESVFREERGLLLASLVRRFGDLDLAEEVTSEAIEAALRHWPAEGVPARPGAWLLTTARRRAVDRLRRDQAYAARLAVLAADAERAEPAPAPDVSGSGPGFGSDELPDERLQLFFTCAHPALAAEDRIALTLRCLAGLTTPEVARAFLVPTATMAQRIVRAKKKIREARIPFRVPAPTNCPSGCPASSRSSTRSSPRGTRPARDPVSSGSIWPRRRSGWPGYCAACCPPSGRAPGSSRCCCSSTPGARPGPGRRASRCSWRTRTGGAGTGR